MRKSNYIVLALLLVASFVVTYLWLFQGYQLTDTIFTGVVPLVLWWIAIAVVAIVLAASDRKHLVESRTVYVGEGSLFSPTDGLVKTGTAPLAKQVEGIVGGIRHGSRGKQFPGEDAFTPRLVVRTTDYQGKPGSEPAVWRGEVVEASRDGEGQRWSFDGERELQSILAARC